MTGRVKLFVITSSMCMVLFLLLGSVLGSSADTGEVYRHFAVFTEVLTRIRGEYVEEPEMKDVTLGAVNGLLEAIDPYASYLNEDQYKQYQKSFKNDRAELGLVLSRKVGYVSVVDTVPGSPADRAGLATGDMLETIGGVATRDMPLAYAQMLLRGKPGSSATVTVLRVRLSAEPQEFRLVREKIKLPDVRSQVINGNIGHIRVQSLEAGKTAEVARHLKRVVKEGAERIVLDVRRSAAGDPAEGLALADLFMDEGLMAYVEGQKRQRSEFQATTGRTVSRLPMVVLANRGTARGAEIAAAALLGNKRCEVVGERSYGDAALREAVPLREGGAVILSVAKYYSPEGKAIQDTGVTPTVVSIARDPLPEIEGEEPRIEPIPEPPIDEDQLLQKAIEVLTKGPTEVAQDHADGAAGERAMSPLNVPRPRP